MGVRNIMTKEKYFEKFNVKELELICTRIEFLNVLVADDFDPVLADEVAHRILNSDSPAFHSDCGNTPIKQTGWEAPQRGKSWHKNPKATSRFFWTD